MLTKTAKKTELLYYSKKYKHIELPIRVILQRSNALGISTFDISNNLNFSESYISPNLLNAKQYIAHLTLLIELRIEHFSHYKDVFTT